MVLFPPFQLTEPDTRLQRFRALMPYRVQEVILVSSMYDAFILQEDGRTTTFGQGADAPVDDSVPTMVRVSDAGEAIERISTTRENSMVIITPQVSGLDPVDLAEEIKAHAGAVPVVLLGYDNSHIKDLLRGRNQSAFDGVFLWTGDSRILNAIVTLVEDRANCLHDCKRVGMRAILLVEDSLNFLSSYLPLLYTEILEQSRSVLSEGINQYDKMLRLRARPKVLLARDLRSAIDRFEEHHEHLLGIISDVGLPSVQGRKPDMKAGLDFVEQVRRTAPHLPILLQSSNADFSEHANKLNSSFVLKGSQVLHLEMRNFLLNNFGFGPFRFRRSDHSVETQARTVREMEAAIKRVSADTLVGHAKRNDFSTWLRARTEFRLANRLAAKVVSDFDDAEELRAFLLQHVHRSRRRAQRGAIVDFHRTTFDDTISFARIGTGSLGGKARGLAFANSTLANFSPANDRVSVRVVIPPTVVLTTVIFDRFMRRNHLQRMALGGGLDEDERLERFLAGRFSASVVSDLRALLRVMQGPLAIRSSSLLEDSHHQPFAGIYETVMVRNVGTEDQRLVELCDAIKTIYASTYSDRARSYLRATAYRHEEEKMAVIIQPLVGRQRGERFYPSFSGVARSHNYYPHGQYGPEDGVCAVALGLGTMVVGGEGGLRFCPRYPQSIPDFSSVDDILENAQRHFYALPMATESIHNPEGHEVSSPDGGPSGPLHPCRYPIADADKDGTLAAVASTWLPNDGRITDGVSREGTRLVTFSNILKHGGFPLAEVVNQVLEIGHAAMGCPIEVEFAVELDNDHSNIRELNLLQVRPMAVAETEVDIELAQIDKDSILCASNRAFGNGFIRNIKHVVYIDPDHFDRAQSTGAASDIAKINAKLEKVGEQYLLIGPGRWGSSDPWLGLPVEWADINCARVVVETGFEDVHVKPSEGSHFFHNMTSFRVGYFTVNPETGDGILDMQWLRSLNSHKVGDHGVRHVPLELPINVMLDGKAAHGVILKPQPGATAPDAGA
ncbi:MAG: PEP/pyruvate-binding domain-containing protein [Planctomycetota bacterium]|nr:PEP/pyruvate-binding domain-containing protein [Planctomycetota bacterium]